jgi:DNA polymerase III subunit epsilon
MAIVAIDFETATSYPSSICSVGIVTIEDSKIVEQFYSLIQPPQNYYNFWNTKVHGINASMTADSKPFSEVYPEIKKRLLGHKIVAHNEAFDRNVLRKALDYFEIEENELDLRYPWKCTVKIYRAKKEGKVNLKDCCNRHGIPLDHHNALSDARGCALLYQKHLDPIFFESNFKI